MKLKVLYNKKWNIASIITNFQSFSVLHLCYTKAALKESGKYPTVKQNLMERIENVLNKAPTVNINSVLSFDRSQCQLLEKVDSILLSST